MTIEYIDDFNLARRLERVIANGGDESEEHGESSKTFLGLAVRRMSLLESSLYHVPDSFAECRTTTRECTCSFNCPQ